MLPSVHLYLIHLCGKLHPIPPVSLYNMGNTGELKRPNKYQKVNLSTQKMLHMWFPANRSQNELGA